MRERNSNFEILRIASMFLIVLHHFSVHGVANAGNFDRFLGGSANILMSELLASLGKVAVIVFVFISGFYLIKSKFKLQRIISLIWNIFFYSVIILIFSYVILGGNISVKDVIVSFFPTTYGEYWFITDYVLLMVFTPFINKFMLENSKRGNQYYLFVLILVSSLLPTLFVKSALSNNELLLFLLFYSIGAYVRLYVGNNDDKHLRKIAKKYLYLGMLMIFGGIVVLNILAVLSKKTAFVSLGMHLIALDSIFTLILAIGLFLYVVTLPPFTNRYINLIAKSALAVYIISDNPLIRSVIWQKIFHVRSLAYKLGSIQLMFYAICITSIIYIICTLIDILKTKTLDKVVAPVPWITKKIETLWLSLAKKFIH